MKKLPVFIFFLGIVIASLGFLAEHATNIPPILRLLTPPSYHDATLGMAKLVDSGELLPQDQGFRVVESLFLDYASSHVNLGVTFRGKSGSLVPEYELRRYR